MDIFAFLGLLGNLLYATACVPMALKTIKLGHDIGNPASTIWTFSIANIAYGLYLLGTFGLHWLFGILFIEAVCWLVALWYHYFPRSPC